MILRYIIHTDERYPAFMKKVTLTDVARLANVSSSAAGKVLNGGSDQIRVGAVALRTQLEGAGLKLRMHGGDGDPLFDSMNIASLDPRYEDIASALLKLLLHPETRDTVPVIEAIYKREMRDDPPSLKLRRTRR